MHESLELRVPEADAARRLPPGAGVSLGSVRKLDLASDDPLLTEIGRIEREYRARGEWFCVSWQVRRTYTREELAAAELFQVKARRVFEPAGEECGTVYDESTACPACGAGATQSTELRLDLRKAPRTVDFAETIAGEQIVSQRLAERMMDAGLQGFTLVPVLHRREPRLDPMDLRDTPAGRRLLEQAAEAGAPHPDWQFWVWLNRAEQRPLLEQATEEHAARQLARERRRKTPVPTWHQLVVKGPPAELSPRTRAGENPFDHGGYGRCPRGDVIGLNTLSEAFVERSSLQETDVMETRQMVGTRRGLLRPRPLLLFSPRVWRVITEAGARGFTVEVAHVVYDGAGHSMRPWSPEIVED